jgi:hypothetical protein
MKNFKHIQYHLKIIDEAKRDGILFINTYNDLKELETKDYLKNVIIRLLETTKLRVFFKNLSINPVISLAIRGLRDEDNNGIPILEKEFLLNIEKKQVKKAVWVVKETTKLPKSAFKEGFYWKNDDDDYYEGIGIDRQELSKFIEESFEEIIVWEIKANERFDINIPKDTSFEQLQLYLHKKYGFILTKSTKLITCFFVSEQ